MDELLILALVLFAIMIVLIVVVVAIDYSGKKEYGEEEWKKVQKQAQENLTRKKYNNYMIECPVCHSNNVKKISNLDRVESVAVWGIASSKIGKQYECDKCHHKW